MKKIMLFILPDCPYCKKVLAIMENLYAEREDYRGLDIEIIDERKQAALADSYDYYYVPCFYLDGVKAHEGAAKESDVRAVLDAALEI